MQQLGDLFPDEFREQLAVNNLKIGSVLRYFDDNTIPPKIKRKVVVGFDADKILFAFLYINTEINPNIFPTQSLRDLHLELDITGRDYLDHKSFLDCSQIFEDDTERVKMLMTNDVNIHKGELSKEDFDNVFKKVKSAKTIATKIKRKYGFI